MNHFVFDIETVPDTNAGRTLYELSDLSDADVAEAMFKLQLQQTGNTFLPHYLQRIVAISALLRANDKLMVWSLGEESASEPEIIQRFFEGIQKFSPTLVSWNGSGFDLPVLHYRALLHKITAAKYWEIGERESDFKWNNYLNRYHYRHLDLMDVLAGYQARANAPLDKLAVCLGLPGKMGMHGSHVWESYLAGDIAGIRNYCETDVMNTYLIFLRFELMRGKLTEDAHEKECQKLREYLTRESKPHFTEFLSKWD